jgi:outer membrane lipoprotein LolB
MKISPSWKRLPGVVFLGLMLAGCANLQQQAPGPPNATAFHARLNTLQALHDWRLRAQVGITTGNNGGSGSVNWRQIGDHVDFRFSGPFGIGGLRISGNGRSWLVQTADNGSFTTTDLARTLDRQVGLPLPLDSLRYWVLGIPDPHAEYARRRIDSQGRLVYLEQEGWRVDYFDYGRYGNLMLPTRLRAVHGSVRIKVAISDWLLGRNPTTARAD